MRNLFKSSLLAIAVAGIAACTPEDNPGGDKGDAKPTISEKDGVVTVMLSRETDYGNDWIYFSLEQRDELKIKEEDHKGNLDWDIAFNRYNFRTNSGLSGDGKGGAMDTGMTDLNAVKEVPSGEFTVDVMGKITENLHSFPPPEIDSPVNEVLNSAVRFTGPPPEYHMNNHVYILRTADGKYAKLQVLGFHNTRGESGYITFRYVYQADGSKTFSK